MNDASELAMLISFLAFFICTPAIAYCVCGNKTNCNYRIISSANSVNWYENSSLV